MSRIPNGMRKTHALIFCELKCPESLLLFAPNLHWNWGAQSKIPACRPVESRFYCFALCIPGFSPIASALRSKLFEPFCSSKFNEWISGHSVWDSGPTGREISIDAWLDWFQNFGTDPIIGSFTHSSAVASNRVANGWQVSLIKRGW